MVFTSKFIRKYSISYTTFWGKKQKQKQKNNKRNGQNQQELSYNGTKSERSLSNSAAKRNTGVSSITDIAHTVAWGVLRTIAP